MDLREQVLQFRTLLQENNLDIDDFELNVNSDAFKQLLDGGDGSLEVRHRGNDVGIDYLYDGTPSWLDSFAADLKDGKFGRSA